MPSANALFKWNIFKVNFKACVGPKDTRATQQFSVNVNAKSKNIRKHQVEDLAGI